MADFKVLTTNSAGTQDAEIHLANAEWTTERGTNASQFTFDYPREQELRLEEGQLITFMMDTEIVFQGYVFSTKSDKDDLISVTAFDQVRYLQNKSTYLFDGETLDKIVKMLANDMGLQTGSISSAATPIYNAHENSKLIDMIEEARNVSMEKEGVIYQVWDDRGKLSMAKLPEDRMTDLFIGDESLLTNYSYEKTIDEDTYNRVILHKKDAKTGKYVIVKAVADENIERWGTLQYFEKADEKMTSAEMQAKADAILFMRNSAKRQLTLEAIGDRACEAGCSIYVGIEQEGLDGWALINRATHRFEGKGAHTMKLEMNMVR